MSGLQDRELNGNLFVPLQFWFNYDTRLAIPIVSLPVPLVSLPYNSRYLDIDFNMDIEIDNNIDNNILNLTEEIINVNKYEICIISLEKIKNNENIVKCNQCSKIIRFELMQEWFNRTKNCPHCRGTFPNTTFLCGKSLIDDDYDDNLANKRRRIE